MRWRPSLLHRYVFGEILAPFLTSLFVFTGVLFLARILRLVKLAVNKNVPIGDILELFSYVIPRFLELAIPMALLIGVLSAFGRLSSDSELVVMRATGISLKQLAKPIAYFSIMAALLTLCISLWLRPWANYRLGIGLFEMAKVRASAGLVPGIFNDLHQLTIYAERIDSEGSSLHNVIISDRRNDPPQVFLAKNGLLVADDVKRSLSLRLYDGSIQQGRGIDYNVTQFDINNINLNERELMDAGPTRDGKKASEMFWGELVRSIGLLSSKPQPLSHEDLKLLTRYRVEWHKRLVLPSACLFVAFIAMALGIQPSRGHSSWGPVANVGMGIVVILLYYVMFALVETVSNRGTGNPAVLMWLPNVLFSFLAFYLFRVMQSERWLAVSQMLGDFFTTVSSWLQINIQRQEA